MPGDGPDRQKKNGQCVLIVAHKGGAIQMWDRHQEALKWQPSPAIVDRVQKAISPDKSSAAVVAELLHAKVAGGPRNTLYFHDIVAFGGESLIGWTHQDRQALLEKVFPGGEQALTHFDLGDGFWRVRNYPKDSKALFAALMARGLAEDEGVVMKNPLAKLTPMNRQSSNAEWQVKSRKPHKNYSF